MCLWNVNTLKQVAYHGSPFKAYEVFITALKTQLFEKGLVLPLLEDHNPAGTVQGCAYKQI